MASAAQTSEKRGVDSDGAEQLASKRAKPDYSDTITVIVGEGDAKKSFIVHKAPVCAKSPFFKAACDADRWAEGKSGVVDIPEHDPKSFELFLHWVYSDRIDVELAGVHRTHYFAPLAKVWSLADYFGATTLCNLVIDRCEIRGREGSCPIPTAFKGLRRGSTIWRLYVDITADCLYQEYFETNQAEYPREVLIDVMKKWLSDEPKIPKSLRQMERCHYHDHPDGEAKCA